MSNFFLELYKEFEKMGMNCKDLDSMLRNLPWKEKERKPDGTIIYTCEIKNDNTKHN